MFHSCSLLAVAAAISIDVVNPCAGGREECWFVLDRLSLRYFIIVDKARLTIIS